MIWPFWKRMKLFFSFMCVCVCVLCCCFLLKDHSKTFYFSISGAPPTFIKFLYRINEKKQSKNLKRKIQQNCPLSDGVTCFASPSPLIVSVHQTHTMLNCQSKWFVKYLKHAFVDRHAHHLILHSFPKLQNEIPNGSVKTKANSQLDST